MSWVLSCHRASNNTVSAVVIYSNTMAGVSQIELHVIVTLSRWLILRHLEVHHLRKVHSGWSLWMSGLAAKSSPSSSKVVPPMHRGCCCCCSAVNRYLRSNLISQNWLQLIWVQPGALVWTPLILWGFWPPTVTSMRQCAIAAFRRYCVALTTWGRITYALVHLSPAVSCLPIIQEQKSPANPQLTERFPVLHVIPRSKMKAQS